MVRNSESRFNSIVLTYYSGAPECSRPDLITQKAKLKVKQNIDTWSLGCVFSEVIRWLAQGHVGVFEYRKERKAEIKQCQIVGTDGASDCFHDGSTALNAVRRSHEISVQQLRKTDFITEAVVHMVNDMLVVADERPTVRGLYRKQIRILAGAKNSLADHKRDVSSSLATSTDERTQPRSYTHPATGPSPNLRPKLPPNLPLETASKLNLPAQNYVKGDRDLGHGHDNPLFFSEDHEFSRLSHEPIAEHSNGSSAPRQYTTHPNTLHHTFPLTPPSTKLPFFVFDTSQFQDREALEHSEHPS
jgi:hypothetical protein